MMIWATRGYCSVIDEVLGVNEFVPKDNSRKTIIQFQLQFHLFTQTTVMLVHEVQCMN